MQWHRRGEILHEHESVSPARDQQEWGSVGYRSVGSVRKGSAVMGGSSNDCPDVVRTEPAVGHYAPQRHDPPTV
jgi:hypothetical protein